MAPPQFGANSVAARDIANVLHPYTDLEAHGVADKVMVATWSEFGRRPKENASGGTDHGAAAPLFIIGKPVAGGLYGEQPSLTRTIDSGNLKYTVDFRSVYQTLIRDWLQGDPAPVLGATFPELPLFAPASALLNPA